MIKRLILLGILALLVASFFPLTAALETRNGVGELAQAYLDRGSGDYGAPNLVTAVVVSYRGLDTLGEVTVLFAASVGVSLAFRRKEHTPHGAREGEAVPEASEILKSGTGLLLPLIVAFGAYIFVHGHLTPGGGFQGGVVIASGVLLALLAGTAREVPHGSLSVLEMLAGAGYVSAGLLGLWLAGGFLDPRFLPAGEFGRLFSAGAIPVIYSLVGIKVGSELSAVISDMRRTA